MTDRVAVFVDYQNVYMGARRAFGGPTWWLEPHWVGQINPRKVGHEIASRMPDRELQTVRVYRGLPDGAKDAKGHGAATKQIATWQSLEDVEAFARPLRYPRDWPHSKAQEKGIDVQLAVDFVMMALDDDYDVGVIFSTDTDLRPPLEAVEQIKGRAGAVEVAAWQRPSGYSRRLSIGEHARRPWCHFLDNGAYNRVADHTDYNI